MSMIRRAAASVLCAVLLASVCATPTFAQGTGNATGHHHKHKHKHKHKHGAKGAHAKHAKKNAN